LRPLELTFPFWGLGAALTATDFFDALAITGHHTFPLTVIYGKDRVVLYFGPSGAKLHFQAI
jgi:hypothetical protein